MQAKPTVVLIHGLFGFSRLLCLEYFKQARLVFEQAGLSVVVPSLPWAGSTEQRAQVLAEQMAALNPEKTGPLHLVAHSMGGVDARYWITHLGGAERVGSLTTLSTPHHGASLADYIVSTCSPFRLFAGVHSLTTDAMTRFNAATPDIATVCYRSYAAVRPIHELPWIMRRYARIITQREGENDGEVARQSAMWGDVIDTLPADHFELIARNFWLNPFQYRKPFDPLPVYADIANWIRLHGEKAEASAGAPGAR